MSWAFFVLGQPRPQARPRVFMAGGQPRAHSPKTSWYGVVYQRACEERPPAPLEGPLCINLELRLLLPKSAPKRKPPYWAPGHVGDVDNYAKAILDAMTQAQWWLDDCQICASHTSKRYAQRGEEPGCMVTVSLCNGSGRVIP